MQPRFGLGRAETVKAGSFKFSLDLVSVERQEGVKVIGRSAFEGCESLDRITIPPTVIHIATNAFIGCDKLKETGLPNYSGFNEGRAYFAPFKLAHPLSLALQPLENDDTEPFLRGPEIPVP
jgi:hypothetical protein